MPEALRWVLAAVALLALAAWCGFAVLAARFRRSFGARPLGTPLVVLVALGLAAAAWFALPLSAT